MPTIQTFSYDLHHLSAIPPRPARSHKGTFGRVLLVCGSVGMCGASYLAGLAAYRTGAGLVELFAPQENRIILQTLLPEAVLTSYRTEDFDAEIPHDDLLRERIEAADAIVIGCGLGRSRATLKMLRTVLTEARVPVVLDADALNMLSDSPSLLARAEQTILTPHFREMSRLCDVDVEEIMADPVTVCRDFALANRLVCVLKDHHTAVSDGSDRVYLNQSGNSGMATGGSGDVLAGILGGLLAQCKDSSLPLFEIACLGVYLHGAAGDAAAEELGEYAMMASDIASHIGTVLKKIHQ